MPQEFIANNKKYQFDRTLKTIRRSICHCGKSLERADIIFSPYTGLNYDEEFLQKMNSMEASIIHCTCSQLYLVREHNDYDYFTYEPIKEVT